jgi:hypothetical protein
MKIEQELTVRRRQNRGPRYLRHIRDTSLRLLPGNSALPRVSQWYHIYPGGWDLHLAPVEGLELRIRDWKLRCDAVQKGRRCLEGRLVHHVREEIG